MKARHILMAAALVLTVAGEARANFILTGSDHLDVTSSHSTGELWNSSTADVKASGQINSAYVNDDALLAVSGGIVFNLYAYDTSNVAFSGGSISCLKSYNTSSVAISGGSASLLYAYNTSSAAISGGDVNGLYALMTCSVAISGGDGDSLYSYDGASSVVISGGTVSNMTIDGSVDISGGSVSDLEVYGTSSVVTFHGYDFVATGGLTIDGQTVLGTGLLAGKWFDGTSWMTSISHHVSGATIRVVPEPATLSLLALGGLAMLRRKRS